MTDSSRGTEETLASVLDLMGISYEMFVTGPYSRQPGSKGDAVIMAADADARLIVRLLDREGVRGSIFRGWRSSLASSEKIPVKIPLDGDDRLGKRLEKLAGKLAFDNEHIYSNPYCAELAKLLHNAGIYRDQETITATAIELSFTGPKKDVSRLHPILEAGDVCVQRVDNNKGSKTSGLTISINRSTLDQLEILNHIGKSPNTAFTRDRHGVPAPQIAKIAAAFDRSRRQGHYLTESFASLG